MLEIDVKLESLGQLLHNYQSYIWGSPTHSVALTKGRFSIRDEEADRRGDRACPLALASP